MVERHCGDVVECLVGRDVRALSIDPAAGIFVSAEGDGGTNIAHFALSKSHILHRGEQRRRERGQRLSGPQLASPAKSNGDAECSGSSAPATRSPLGIHFTTDRIHLETMVFDDWSDWLRRR